MVESIIKEMEDLGALSLFDLARVCLSHTLFYFMFYSLANGCFWFQASVDIKVLHDKCVAQEGVIRWFRKCQDIHNKEMDQYKEVVRALNKELTTVIEN